MRKKIVLLISGILPLVVAGCAAVNPITGRERLMLNSESAELEMGRTCAPEIEKQMGGRLRDEVVQGYIDSVGQRITRVSHRPDLQYHFTALDTKIINAFALPGGYVFITGGMLEKLDNESELAGIFGHEVTHIVARHYAEAMAQQVGMELLLVAAASTTNSAGAVQLADAARQIVGLQFSKDDERQADLTGMDYMVSAGYDPNGVLEAMEMLRRQEQSGTVDFLSSHPASQSRIAYLAQRIQTKYGDIKGLKTGKEDYHRLVLERLIK